MNCIQRNALNEAKKYLWTAKEPIKTLAAQIKEGSALPEDAGQTLENALHSLALLGARLRELERD